MFLSDPKNQKEMSDHQFFSTMAMLAIGALLIWSMKNGIDLQLMMWNLIYFFIAAVPIAVGAVLGVRHIKGELSVGKRGLLPFLNGENGIFVAQTNDRRNLFLPEQIRTGHVQIVGSTGRGKTESVILPMIVRDLLRGNSPLLIDGKGDRSLIDKVYGL